MIRECTLLRVPHYQLFVVALETKSIVATGVGSSTFKQLVAEVAGLFNTVLPASASTAGHSSIHRPKETLRKFPVFSTAIMKSLIHAYDDNVGKRIFIYFLLYTTSKEAAWSSGQRDAFSSSFSVGRCRPEFELGSELGQADLKSSWDTALMTSLSATLCYRSCGTDK